jgi:hypothetical protein
MVMLGFAGAFRKSGVVALNAEDLEFCDEGVRVTIRRSKTDQEAKGQDHCGPARRPSILSGAAVAGMAGRGWHY